MTAILHIITVLLVDGVGHEVAGRFCEAMAALRLDALIPQLPMQMQWCWLFHKFRLYVLGLLSMHLVRCFGQFGDLLVLNGDLVKEVVVCAKVELLAL